MLLLLGYFKGNNLLSILYYLSRGSRNFESFFSLYLRPSKADASEDLSQETWTGNNEHLINITELLALS